VRRELHEAGVNPKLLDQVDGPYEVVSNDDHTLLLRKGPHLVRANSDRITPAPKIPDADRGPPLDAQDEDATGVPPTDPMLESSEEGHVIDRIVWLRKEQDGTPRYRVWWYGYGREYDTWEPQEHLPEPLVRSYDRWVGLEWSL
jgi:Chromo (CHRromatin Organisation MOdifier) domain